MDKTVEKYLKRRDARLKKRTDEFNENDHPRDENGRFASGGANRAVPAKDLPKKEATPFNEARVVRGKETKGTEGLKSSEKSSGVESGGSRPRPKTKIEIMKNSKKMYEKAQNEIGGMKPGLQRDVKEKLILPWIKGDNWMGGISDRKFEQVAKKMPYTFDEIYSEFHKQMMDYS